MDMSVGRHRWVLSGRAATAGGGVLTRLVHTRGAILVNMTPTPDGGDRRQTGAHCEDAWLLFSRGLVRPRQVQVRRTR